MRCVATDPDAHIELFDEAGRSRGHYSNRNRLNGLTGREWVFSSRSVIAKTYPPSYQHALRNRHGGQKPPELCAEIIQMFTKPGGRVLDPMMGVGGTLLGAHISGRSAVGIEIEPAWVDVYHEVCRLESIEPMRTHVGDCRDVLKTMPDEFDFLLTDVPYWNMDTAPRSRGKFKRVGQASENGKIRKNLSRFNAMPAQDKCSWLEQMAEIFRLCRSKIRHNGYMAVFVGEMYQDGEYHFLPADLAQVVARENWKPKANLIWYDTGKQLHIYGYRYAFIPSIIHQSILIFRNE